MWRGSTSTSRGRARRCRRPPRPRSRAVGRPAISSSRRRRSRMPRPPPPAAALRMTGSRSRRPGAAPRRRIGERLAAAGHHRHPGRGASSRALALSPIRRMVAARGPRRPGASCRPPRSARSRPGSRSRVNGVGAGDLGGRDERRDVEVAVVRRRRADADVLVGIAACRLSRSASRRPPPSRCRARGGADDAQRDLAAVGDQDLFEHARRAATKAPRRRWLDRLPKSGSPNSTG